MKKIAFAALFLVGCNSQLGEKPVFRQDALRLSRANAAREVMDKLDRSLQPLETALKQIPLTLQSEKVLVETGSVDQLQHTLQTLREGLKDSARSISDSTEEHWSLTQVVKVNPDTTGATCGEVTVSVYGVSELNRDLLEVWIQKCIDSPTLFLKVSNESGNLSVELQSDGLRTLITKELNFDGCKFRMSPDQTDMSCEPMKILANYPDYIQLSELKAKQNDRGFFQHTDIKVMKSEGESESVSAHLSLEIEPGSLPKVESKTESVQ